MAEGKGRKRRGGEHKRGQQKGTTKMTKTRKTTTMVKPLFLQDYVLPQAMVCGIRLSPSLPKRHVAKDDTKLPSGLVQGKRRLQRLRPRRPPPSTIYLLTLTPHVLLSDRDWADHCLLRRNVLDLLHIKESDSIMSLESEVGASLSRKVELRHRILRSLPSRQRASAGCGICLSHILISQREG